MSRTIHIVLAGMAIAAVAGAGVAAALEPPASRPRAEAALSGPLPPDWVLARFSAVPVTVPRALPRRAAPRAGSER